MKKILLLVSFVLFTLLSFSTNDLDAFRKQFKSIENKETAQKFLDAKVEEKSMNAKITIKAYKAVCTMMMAQYVMNPITKYSWFNEGKAMLEQSIKMNRNVENVHLRLMVQINAPSIVGYSSNIAKDREYILKNLENASISEEAKKGIIKNLMASDEAKYYTELAKKYGVK